MVSTVGISDASRGLSDCTWTSGGKLTFSDTRTVLPGCACASSTTGVTSAFGLPGCA
jgi:hypothetical protein